MSTFELYFSDLTEEAQKRFLKAEGIKNPEEANYDVFPIATIELDDIEESDLSETLKKLNNLMSENI